MQFAIRSLQFAVRNSPSLSRPFAHEPDDGVEQEEEEQAARHAEEGEDGAAASVKEPDQAAADDVEQNEEADHKASLRTLCKTLHSRHLYLWQSLNRPIS
jgi:hypothetical protein